MAHGAGELPGVFHGDVGIVAQHVHAQRHARVGHQHADGAQADDAERLALQFGADELALALLHQLFHFRALAGERFAPLHAVDHLAGGEQHAGDDQLFNGVGVRARGVEDHDAALGQFVQRDVVHARAGARHALDAFGDVHLVHVR